MKYLTPNLIVTKKGEKHRLSKNFYSHEFDCPMGEWTLIDLRLVEILQAIRDFVGKPVKITSGFRSKEYQLDLKRRGYETAKGMSTHEVGAAVDISVTGMSGQELEAVAESQGIKAIGVGQSFIHIDLRNDKTRRWTYSS